jgi:hypothetical protein
VIEMPSGAMEDPVISVDENLLISNVASGNQWLPGSDICRDLPGRSVPCQPSIISTTDIFCVLPYTTILRHL